MGKYIEGIWKWYNRLSNRVRTSAKISFGIVGLISTLFTITGFSLAACFNSVCARLVVVFIMLCISYAFVHEVIGWIYKDSISFNIRSIPVEVLVGDIFTVPGFKVIGCDTHFDTRVDDVVISKTSLHGQLVLKHGKKEEIEEAIERKAQTLGLTKNDDGLYDFPLGTVIRYDSSVDQQTYLMLALTEMRKINGQYKAYTSMSKFEHMLRTMWDEIDGIYVYNDITLPLLGSGISRFEGGGKNNEALLHCMLCTLNSSEVEYTSKVRIVIYGNVKDIPLYEYKGMFKSLTMR
ncbi:MAG: DUF6430 domain-containing protein [Butyrivibrio sp.]|nr:DUF6430 domain-containing protein [Butyrivibrio sp.]